MSEESLVTLIQQSLKLFEAINSSKTTVQTLVDILNNEPTNHLREFAFYLQSVCGIPPKLVGLMAQQLMERRLFGIKAIHLWLQFKIYEILNISIQDEANINSKKRRKVANAFIRHNFYRSNFQNLLEECCAVLQLDPRQYQDEINLIEQSNVSGLGLIFSKDQEKSNQNKQMLQKKSEDQEKIFIEQRLKDLIKDFEFIPKGCQQKYIQYRIILAYVDKYFLAESETAKGFMDSHNQDHNQYTHQQKFRHQRQELLQLFHKTDRGENTHAQLIQLKSQLLLIDILELERLIIKFNEAKLMIEDKHILLAIGSSRSQKTANALKFLGYNFKQTRFSLNGIGHIRQEHLGFHPIGSSQFAARYINAATIPEQMLKFDPSGQKKKIAFCVSPQFGDAGGVQADLANGISMANTLYAARQLHVIWFVSYDQLNGCLPQWTKECQSVSNFFKVAQGFECLTIYFTRVPQDGISLIPLLIEKHIHYLSQNNTTNQKLHILLKIMLKSSKKIQQFLSPFASNYKQKLIDLLAEPRILQFNKIFHYRFTENTKNIISRFAEKEKLRMERLINSASYEIIKYRLILVQKLMNFLYDHDQDKIRLLYDDLIQMMQRHHRKQIQAFKDNIDKMMISKTNKGLKERFDSCKANIIETQNILKDLSIHNDQSSKLEDILQQKSKQLLDRITNFGNSNQGIIMNMNFPSTLVGQKIHHRLTVQVEQKFNRQYELLRQQLASEKCDNIQAYSRILYNLEELGKQLENYGSNGLRNQLDNLQNILKNQIQLSFRVIANSIINNQCRITIQNAKNANQMIKRILIIKDLPFMTDSLEIQQRLKRQMVKIKAKCKRLMRQLQNSQLILNDSCGYFGVDIHKFKMARQQVELHLIVGDLKDELSLDYTLTKQNIVSIFTKDMDIIKTYIANLNGCTCKQLEIGVQKIIQSTNILMGCLDIMEIRNEDKGINILKQIEKSFLHYLNRQRSQVKYFKLRLNSINKNTSWSLKEVYRKIQSYKKVNNFGQQVQDSLNEFTKSWITILKQPFEEFSQYISRLLAQGHYKSTSQIFHKLKKFVKYVFILEGTSNIKDYIDIGENEIRIIKIVQRICVDMNRDIQKFLKFQLKQSENSCPDYLNDLVKTLLLLSQNSKIADYLNRKAQFKVLEKLGQVERHLENILAVCRGFKEVDAIFKSKKAIFRRQYQQIHNMFNQDRQKNEQPN